MRLFWCITAGAAFVSVLSARLADAFLDHRIALMGDFAGLQYSLNPGIAWGMRLPAGIQEAAIGIALIVVVILAHREAKQSASLPPTPYPLISYALITGGGLANIIDRMPDGVVTDYFQIGSFPIFNVADSCVTVGVALLLLTTMNLAKT
ncbi:signal peptidase II [Candidatus Peregrinibacteria bacterium]|nr:signal peptidase II [Candidatus Peregrinibacteria bacterium]